MAVKPDRSFDLIELKRPGIKTMIVWQPGRERFSQYVVSYIQQVREYQRWFENESNRQWFAGTYGALRLQVLRPEATLIVGNREALQDDAVFRRLNREVQDVQVKTYDQVFQEADLLYQYMTSH